MNNRFLIGFTLIAIITGVNVYNHQEDYSGTIEFNNYGFSLRYPSNAMIWEAGFPDLGSGTSDFSGRFQATRVSGNELIEQILVLWTVIPNTQENYTLDNELMDIIDEISLDSNITVENFSEFKTHEIGEHKLLYVYFEGMQPGLKFNSMIGVMVLPWESLRSNRGYIIGYISIDGVYSEIELEGKYLDFLESFKPVS